ncbi:MAG TPA: CxxxxCH/CxxCH domain-containing protein [Anaeromyxobacteraceae bacterium]|nr:CxxxxCH/CxxCH domain-containing protein [Anaeromyxobacteraceae bacterium]
MIGAVGVGCEVGGPLARGSAGAQGQVGTTFNVLVGKPLNGTVTSGDGKIVCGTGGSACAADYDWAVSVILTATPDAGYGLQSWAGDCTQAGECILDTKEHGADKYVVAVFNPVGELGHSNWNSPEFHAPAYRDFLAQAPGALQCTKCHGVTLQGQGIAVSCDACHATNGYGHWKASNSCTSCHGDATRVAVTGADPLVSAAPPMDTQGNLTRGTRGVGAHEAHLNGVARPVACSECHPIPTATSHANGTVSVAFGALARTGGASPSWNGASCSSTYCHGATLGGGANTLPVWISGPSQATCGSCHGLPPPAPHTTSTSCGDCHAGYTATTVDRAKHVNGIVDVTTAPSCGSCHGIPPTVNGHTASTACESCHSGYTSTTVNASLHQNGAVDVIQNPSCGSCHGIPPTVNGHTASTACESCHTGYTSTTVNAALHRNGTVETTCTACHGSPPSTGRHTRSDHVDAGCGACHPGYTETTANPATHRDGQKNTGNKIVTYDSGSRSCTSTCHGSETW